MFYEQLIKLCEERNIKITPLVRSLGLGEGGIKRWRDGSSPTGDTLLKFANYFGVTTDYLLGNTDNPGVQQKSASSDMSKEEALKILLRDILGHEPTKEDEESCEKMLKVFLEESHKLKK